MTEQARRAVASYATAALHGAATGALPGVLVSWFIGLMNRLNPVVSGLFLAPYGPRGGRPRSGPAPS
ncbi:hypothetical protein ACFY2J_23995 [Streptomyces collinus]|uniref:hypothetical protein n=1 Tax=Streptomyces collinus TaxID=42684 RepID=UPI0036763658